MKSLLVAWCVRFRQIALNKPLITFTFVCVVAVTSLLPLVTFTVSVHQDETVGPGLSSAWRSASVTTAQALPTPTYEVTQILRGKVFNKTTKVGETHDEISAIIRLSVVKALSPPVVAHVREIFNDEYGENVYFATIPAMVSLGDKIKVVQRIWLAQFEMMRNTYRQHDQSIDHMFNEWHNSWQENFLYEMDMDENYNLLSPGRIMGIPTTTNMKYSYKSDGPMDPRLVKVGGDDFYLVFHTWLVDKNSGEIGGRVHTYDMFRKVKRKLWPHIKLQVTEINWIPLDVGGQLHLTYSIDPLRVMRCDPKTGDCQFIYDQPKTADHPFRYSNDHLRGGTPWVVYRHPYYISLAHNVAVTYQPYEDFAIYNANLVVLSVEPWRVVYVSHNIEASKDWLNSEPVIRNHTIVAPFWYPTGLILRDADTIDVSCHLNDASGYVLRLRGLAQLMDEVITRDELYTVEEADCESNGWEADPGPGIRVVQQYVLESTKEKYAGSWTFQGDILERTVEGVDILLPTDIG